MSFLESSPIQSYPFSLQAKSISINTHLVKFNLWIELLAGIFDYLFLNGRFCVDTKKDRLKTFAFQRHIMVNFTHIPGFLMMYGLLRSECSIHKRWPRNDQPHLLLIRPIFCFCSPLITEYVFYGTVCVWTFFYVLILHIKNERLKKCFAKHWKDRFHHFVNVKTDANAFVIIAIMTPHEQRIIDLRQTAEPCGVAQIDGIKLFFLYPQLFGYPSLQFVLGHIRIVYQLRMTIEWVVQLGCIGKLEIPIPRHALCTIDVQIFIEDTRHLFSIINHLPVC